MREQIRPADSVHGSVELPGDKSISHRYAMLAAIAEGTTKIANYSSGADCQSTLACVRALGAGIETVEPVLRFMETHASMDFGAPGPLDSDDVLAAGAIGETRGVCTRGAVAAGYPRRGPASA